MVQDESKNLQILRNFLLIRFFFFLTIFFPFNYVDIKTYSPHPGFTHTNIFHQCKGFIGFSTIMSMKLFAITAKQGAINILYPVLSPENKETGKFYVKGIEQKPNKLANDQELSKKLWDVSEKILKDHGMI